MQKDKKCAKIGLLSPFLPKKDGIAIYSNNLLSHLKGVKAVKIGDFDSDADYKLDFRSFSLKKEVSRIADKEGIELLHVQYVPTLFGKYNLNMNLIKALELSVPVITTLHEVHYSSGCVKDCVLSWIEKQIVRKSDKVIVHTPQQKKFLERKYKSNNVVCIYHGLNFYKSNKRNNNNILFFGYITPLKGIEYLIEAMKHLPDCSLKIAGHTPKGVSKGYKDKLLKKVEDSKIGARINVDIRWIPEEEKDAYFRWADIVVLPYLWGPYQSGILHNAMSYGIPVVTTNVGSLHEVVELFRVGEIVPPEKSSMLAEGIKKVFSKYDLYKKMVEKYRISANWEKVAEEHRKLYNGVI